MKKEAYTVSEFCQQHSISRHSFYDQLNAGRIQAVKCGRRTLITPAAAKRWLKSLPVHPSACKCGLDRLKSQKLRLPFIHEWL